MDRALASAIAHRWHPVAAPVSDASLHRLVLRLGPVERVLDLGRGSGEWLFAALPAAPGAHGVGVDDRVVFEEAEAAAFGGDGFEAVLCVGASTPSAGSPARSRPARAPAPGRAGAAGRGLLGWRADAAGDERWGPGSYPTSPVWSRRPARPVARLATGTSARLRDPGSVRPPLTVGGPLQGGH